MISASTGGRIPPLLARAIATSRADGSVSRAHRSARRKWERYSRLERRLRCEGRIAQHATVRVQRPRAARRSRRPARAARRASDPPLPLPRSSSTRRSGCGS